MINLENIGVHLPQGYLFKDLNFQINKGDKIGLVGKNGAGKSTLLKLIAKFDKPSEGRNTSAIWHYCWFFNAGYQN